jgi:hypothetical protein
MKKKLLITLAILVVLPILGLALAAVMIDSIVRNGTEKAATAALKVPTTLGGATIKYAGRATLDKFEIANPEGFKEPRAVAFERFDTSLRVGSLLEDVIEISDVLVQKPDLTVEFVGAKSNWSTLMENLSSGSSDTAHRTAPAKPGEAGAGKRFRITRLRIEGATVRFRSDLIPGGAMSFTLPTIELKGIGNAPGGASMPEVLGILLQSLAGESSRAAESRLPGQLLGQFKGEIGGAVQAFKGAFDSVLPKLKDASGRALEGIKNEAKDVEKAFENGVKDLLEKKK